MNADKAWPLLADPSRNEILQLLRGELVSQLQSLRSLTGRIQQLEQAIASYRGRLADRSDSWHWPTELHGAYRSDWRCPNVPPGTRDGRLSSSGSAPVGRRRSGTAATHARAVDPDIAPATAEERGDRGVGADRVGTSGLWAKL